MNNQFFTDSLTNIEVIDYHNLVVIKCEKLKMVKDDLRALITNVVSCVSGQLKTEFDKYEHIKISCLSALEECETVIYDGLPVSAPPKFTKDCKIKFDLVFDVMNGILDFRTVINIMK